MRRVLGLIGLAVLAALRRRAQRRGPTGRPSRPGAAERAADGRSPAHRDLDLLFAHLAELRRIAEAPASEVLYDFSIRWGTMLSGRLQRLDYYYRRGELTAAERERFEALARELHSSRATIDRLRLPRPATVLLG
jgi:hypothetical protein